MRDHSGVNPGMGRTAECERPVRVEMSMGGLYVREGREQSSLGPVRCYISVSEKRHV